MKKDRFWMKAVAGACIFLFLVLCVAAWFNAGKKGKRGGASETGS